MSSSLVALCVGHSRKIFGRTEGGAISVGGVSEHVYNSDLAERILQKLATVGISAFVVNEYDGSSYGSAQTWLARHLKERGATIAVELHFNSAAPAATGHEWLYWHASQKGKRLAELLSLCFGPLPLKARGAKAITSSSRGADFVSKTHCPAVIAEPFFGSNPEDWAIATSRKNEIAMAIVGAIREYAKA